MYRYEHAELGFDYCGKADTHFEVILAIHHSRTRALSTNLFLSGRQLPIDLWTKAVQCLGRSDRLDLDLQRTDRGQVLQDLLHTVEERKQSAVERQWTHTRRNGDVIVIRDSLDQVVEWIKKFRAVGDSAMQYDTGHAALPWAGVRFLLTVS